MTVVISILSAVSLVAYSGIQQQARDARRVSDIQSIQQGLAVYKGIHGQYPASSAPAWGAWDSSADTRNGHVFMKNLKDANIMSHIPSNPVNKTFDIQENNDGYQYAYFTCDLDMLQGWLVGCPLNRGKLAVLMVQRFEGGSVPESNPGFRCRPIGGNGDFDHNYPNAWVRGRL